MHRTAIALGQEYHAAGFYRWNANSSRGYRQYLILSYPFVFLGKCGTVRVKYLAQEQM